MTSITVAKFNAFSTTTCSTPGVDARPIQSLDYSSNNEKIMPTYQVGYHEISQNLVIYDE